MWGWGGGEEGGKGGRRGERGEMGGGGVTEDRPTSPFNAARRDSESPVVLLKQCVHKYICWERRHVFFVSIVILIYYTIRDKGHTKNPHPSWTILNYTSSTVILQYSKLCHKI